MTLRRLIRSVLMLAILLVGAIGLTACSGSSGGGTPPDTTPEPEPEPEPDPDSDLPPGGVSVITPRPATDFNLYAGDNDGPVGSADTVEADHERFDQAVRVNVTNPSGAFWNGQVQYPVNADVASGDVLLIRLYFRSVENTEETGAGFATFFIEGPGPDYTKYAERALSSTGDWEEYFIPVEMPGSESAGELVVKVGFGAGDRAQVFDVGGVEVWNYGTSVALEDLPRTELSYVGREADADWREAAAKRIEQHRKGDFTLQVVDGEGEPVAGAELSVAMTSHAYHFGSVTVGNLLTGDSPDSERYRETVLELFNQSGPENDLKWAPWIGEWGENFNQADTIAGLQWLKDHGLYTRGHVMVWPSKRNLPEFMQPYLPEGEPENADPQARQEVLDHIDDIATATLHVLDEWDVLNEPYDNHYLMDAFGKDVMVDWFERARMNLDEHRLYINDYSILSGGGRDTAHQDHYEQTIRYLLENNAPLNGIGMQGHFGSSPTAIARVYDILERFHSEFEALDIRVTEFDIDTTDEDLQADYTRDFLTIVFSHPATVGVQKWGFWAGAHWNPDAALYTEDWREKPNARAWKDTIYDDWWSEFSGTTGAEGRFSARGFYGSYDVRVTLDGKETVQAFELVPEGPETISVELSE